MVHPGFESGCHVGEGWGSICKDNRRRDSERPITRVSVDCQVDSVGGPTPILFLDSRNECGDRVVSTGCLLTDPIEVRLWLL